jgi:hypothetical protein
MAGARALSERELDRELSRKDSELMTMAVLDTPSFMLFFSGMHAAPHHTPARHLT